MPCNIKNLAFEFHPINPPLQPLTTIRDAQEDVQELEWEERCREERKEERLEEERRLESSQDRQRLDYRDDGEGGVQDRQEVHK